MPEGQRLPRNVRHQRRAAVHPQDRGGLRRESVRTKGPVQVSVKKLFSEEVMRCLTVLSSQRCGCSFVVAGSGWDISM